MEPTRNVKLGFWVVGIIGVPLLTIVVYNMQSIIYLNYDLIGFLALMAIVSFLPIIVNDTPVFFIHGVSLAVFLYYGLFVELILIQIAILILLVKIRVSKEDHHRIPLNLFMFSTVSVTSGSVFYLLGGTHGYIDFSDPINLISVLGYIVTSFFTNHFLLIFIRTVIFKVRTPFVSRNFFWDLYSTLLVSPVGIVLYLLYLDMGTVAILYVGIPFISLALILNILHSSQKVNNLLQKTSEVGHQLTGRLQVDEVLDLFIEKITDTIPSDYAYIWDVTEGEELSVLRYVEKNTKKRLNLKNLKLNDGISGTVWAQRKPLLYSTRTQWQHLSIGILPGAVESVMCVPVERNQKIVGIITIASNQKRVYDKSQLMILDILSNYLAVAFENARNYEQTKFNSERCPLTNLYNYRYFENLLEENLKMKKRNLPKNHLSIILLDIDHFKAVNDTYGHQSGNEILCQLSDRLVKLISEKGTVARYGGEEFVILLPNIEREKALLIAEDVRKNISTQPFILHDDLNEERRKLMVRITASIGVATAPDDADEPLALIRHADRAMYTGAKQQGRNKVAGYVK